MVHVTLKVGTGVSYSESPVIRWVDLPPSTDLSSAALSQILWKMPRDGKTIPCLRMTHRPDREIDHGSGQCPIYGTGLQTSAGDS